jgi:8-oxo-dGTP pyrophosphatase MutT (NUDIX family)
MASDPTTWDGRARATEPPFGAVVVVYRYGLSSLEFLILHRAHNGEAYEGDWAWTPPSGCRFPGESIEACAQRELLEEAGLSVVARPLPAPGSDWVVFMAEVTPDIEVVLDDPEHDRFEWVDLDEAIRRCMPPTVAAAFRRVAKHLQP